MAAGKYLGGDAAAAGGVGDGGGIVRGTGHHGTGSTCELDQGAACDGSYVQYTTVASMYPTRKTRRGGRGVPVWADFKNL